jgi:hypothetical protein
MLAVAAPLAPAAGGMLLGEFTLLETAPALLAELKAVGRFVKRL